MSNPLSSQKRDRHDSGNGAETGDGSGDHPKKLGRPEKEEDQKQVQWKVNLYPNEAEELNTMATLFSMTRRKLVLHLMELNKEALQSAPVKPGRREKPDGQKLRDWKVNLYRKEVDELNSMAAISSLSRRELLLHLMELSKGDRHSTPEKSARRGLEVRAMQEMPSPIPHDGGAGVQQPQRRIPTYAGAAAAHEGGAGLQEPQRRIPIYAGAAATHATDLEWDLQDNDVYEYDECGSFQLNVQPRRDGRADADSFNIPDRGGPGFRSPSPVDENSPQQKLKRDLEKKWKEQEPMEYDYSECTRLLEPGYWKAFSDDRKVRLHVPKTPIISKDGLLIKPPAGKMRTQQQKTMDALELVQDGRYIVEFHQILKLISSKCYVSKCGASNNLDPETLKKDIKRVGGVLEVTVRCCGDPALLNEIHTFKWSSSRKLQHFEDPLSQPYALNVLLPSAIVVSGNQFKAMEFFFKTMNIRTARVRQWVRIQKFLICPVIEEIWRIEQRLITDNIRANNFRVICAADGQFDRGPAQGRFYPVPMPAFDSPGKCAMYCTYSQMVIGLEKDMPDKTVKTERTAYLLDITLTEKRHAELHSPNMEVIGFLRSMLSLRSLDIPICEVVTDAHKTVKALMEFSRKNPHQFVKDAKEYLSAFKDIDDGMIQILLQTCRSVKHRLDVWHKAKNIGGALLEKKVGRERSTHLLPWIPAIKNHFWHAAKNCEGDAYKMAAIWTSALHHVLGEHTWSGGQCGHEELDPPEERPPELEPDSETFKAISEVVLSREILQTLHYYTSFRHTGVVESFNALQLRYAMKLIYYLYAGMFNRKILAALDWNDGVHREVIRDPNGKIKLRKIWSKKSNGWVLRYEKEEKRYSHVPHVMARIVSEACMSSFRLNDRHKSNVPIIPNNPKDLAPNTAKTQVDFKDVERKMKCRFGPAYWTAPDAAEEEEVDVDLDLDENGVNPYEWVEEEEEEEEEFHYRVRLDEDAGKLKILRRPEDYTVTMQDVGKLIISRKGLEGDDK